MTGRVLIVSTDDAFRDALRDAVAAQSGQWGVDACSDGADALDRMEDHPAATLVTDTAITGIACEDLLAETRRRFPQAVRLVLVGGVDQQVLVRLNALAHRVLPKPCEPADVLGAVERTQSLRELLGSPALAAVIGRLASIPTLSSLYTQIADQLSYPDYSLATVGELVGRDVGIAAKVIQMANSALIGLRRPASSPSQAVRVLGADLTRSLVLAADLFSRYDPAALRPFSIDALWEHSRRVAELAGRIAVAEKAPDRVVREATLSGLFHDIGRLMIASQLPGPYKEVLALLRAEPVPVAEAERRVLGSSHAEVGGYLLGLWGLPDGIIEAVVWHHHPSACPGSGFTALTAVHAAEAIVGGDEGAALDDEYLERLGLTARVGEWSRLTLRRV